VKFLRDWRECVDVDWPQHEITERTREVSYRMAQRGYRADSRVATGRIYTSTEFEERRQKSRLP
jgi:hypothetical protein